MRGRHADADRTHPGNYKVAARITCGNSTDSAPSLCDRPIGHALDGSCPQRGLLRGLRGVIARTLLGCIQHVCVCHCAEIQPMLRWLCLWTRRELRVAAARLCALSSIRGWCLTKIRLSNFRKPQEIASSWTHGNGMRMRRDSVNIRPRLDAPLAKPRSVHPSAQHFQAE